MSTLADLFALIERLRGRGVVIELASGRVRVAPSRLVRINERATLQEHAAELRGFLQDEIDCGLAVEIEPDFFSPEKKSAELEQPNVLQPGKTVDDFPTRKSSTVEPEPEPFDPDRQHRWRQVLTMENGKLVTRTVIDKPQPKPPPPLTATDRRHVLDAIERAGRNTITVDQLVAQDREANRNRRG